jgi:hypothetical protein
MHRYSYIRSILRNSLCLAALLAAPADFQAASPRQQAQAPLLDHAEFPCVNCFFARSDRYYCFQADNQILIAHRKIPVVNWQDESKNYITRVHPAWKDWTPPGQTVPISFDDKHVWLRQANGKELKLARVFTGDIFTNNAQCRAVKGAQAH